MGRLFSWLVRCIFSLECLQIWKKCSTFALKRYFTRYVVSIRIIVAFGGHGVGCSDGVSAARGMECAVE